MKKLLSLILITILFIACKQKTKDTSITLKQKKVIVEKSTTQKLKSNDNKKVEVQTIEEFLKQLQIAVKNNNINYLENNIVFPFEYKSGGELVDSYNSYRELNKNGKFSIILKARYVKKCNEEIRNVKYYCITYFDNIIDVTFYVAKKNNVFKLIKMETPN